jgi:long-chain acyl-CoA synthetase
MKNNPQEASYPWYKNYDRNVPYHMHYPQICVHQLFDLSAAVDPSHICLVFGNEELTYGEVQTFSIAYARRLISIGVKPDDRVGLVLPNCPKFIIAFLAILRAGAVVTAINPLSTAHEMRFQVEDASVKYLIGDILIEPVLEDAVKETSTRIMVLEDNGSSREFFTRVYDLKSTNESIDLLADELNLTESIELPLVAPEAPAIFQYSGGTTGVPKAAIGSHKGIVANTIQFSVWLTSLKEGQEIWLSAIPFYHVYGMVIALFVGIHKRATLVVLPDARDTEMVVKAAIKHQVTFLPGVPALFSAIIDYLESMMMMDEKFCIKACISGSASLHEKTKHRFEELTGSRILEGYGLSEAPTATHCNPLQGENKTGSIGLPLPDVICRIVDIGNGMNEVAPGEAGELIIQGPQVMLGYHNHLTENKLALKNGWLYTGDIARVDSDGYFYLIDRKKDLIKVGGFQVWPKEVETELMLHPSVSEAAVAGVANQETYEEKVHAWVVLKPGMVATDEDLKFWCSKTLSRYKIPREFHYMEKLPRSPVGKILRRELKTTII